jgi:hypothetical protein
MKTDTIFILSTVIRTLIHRQTMEMTTKLNAMNIPKYKDKAHPNKGKASQYFPGIVSKLSGVNSANNSFTPIFIEVGISTLALIRKPFEGNREVFWAKIATLPLTL